MSLLLDALKKAAKEKQSADAGNADGEEHRELELDALEGAVTEATDSDQEDAAIADDSGDTTTADISGRHIERSHSGHPGDVSLDAVSATPLTVSDEALQVLVHKANAQFRSTQRLTWSGVILVTLMILITGAVYFYYGMSEDVEAIERKHALVMRTVTDTQLSRTVTEKIEQQQALEEAQKNSVKLADSESMQREATKRQSIKNANKKIVFKKIKKLDPIDLLATRAWNAYIAEDYETSKSIYKDILRREENNRDALLGIAAISVKQDDVESAKSIYRELVQLDPRDPIAVAALSNLEKASLGGLGESKLKLMIRKNSNSAHLHFALGNVYSHKSRWPEAQKEYFNAWQGDKNNADYAFNLAVSLDQMGKQKEAIKFYKKSLTNADLGNTEFSTEAAESRLQQLSDGQ